MTDILQKQYAMLKSSREAVLKFIETKVGADLNIPFPAYENRTIYDLLKHSAGCYLDWLVHFALQQPVKLLDDGDFPTVDLIRQLYIQVDDAMAVFLEKFKDTLGVPVSSTLPDGWPVSATPLEVFTQVLTHEFHHKGQIMLMCRLFNHKPPETDIAISFH